MACDCTTYACLETVINLTDCPDEIELVLPADETGSWIFSYEFNGKWFGGSIDVVDTENITVPFVFNESYIHVIKFFKEDGTLFNDTCYKLDTSKIVGNYTAATVTEENIFNVTVAAAGASFTSSKINSRPVMVVMKGSQAYNRNAVNFTQSGNTVTMTNGISWAAGTIVTVIISH